MRKSQTAMPELQIDENETDETNKENMPTLSPTNKKTKKRKRSKSRKKSLFEPVPPLQLLTDDNINDNRDISVEAEVETETVEESGDIITNNSNNSNTLESPPEMIPIIDTNTNTNHRTNNNNLKIKLSKNGRLLESQSEYNKRSKVSYVGTEMTFRPLRMKCTHCDEAYTKTHDLYAHIRNHQHHTKCPHCGKILTCMATFVYHVRTHTAEKPYYCPVDKCDFTNAVKYNLKVHLACIRHGGKENLKKYAKVLDLDVCEKSLKKRKDNSVHELGSRRCKKRRKLNNINQSPNETQVISAVPPQINSAFYPKQEMGMGSMGEYELYDTVAASLLYHFPLVFDSNMSGMNGMSNAMTVNGQPSLVDWNSIVPNQSNYKSENGQSIIKSEKESICNNSNNNGSIMLKLEQYYDPLYGYYSYNNSNNITHQTSPSASTIWDSHKLDNSQSQMNLNISNTNTHTPQSITPNNSSNNKAEQTIIPKQEPIFSNEYSCNGQMNAPFMNAPPMPMHMSGPMIAPPNANMYYPNPYYMSSMSMNYDNTVLYNNNANINNNNNNNKVEVPPLPDLFPDNDSMVPSNCRNN